MTLSPSAFLRPLTMSLFMAGVMVGALSLGWVSDRYGRRFTLGLTLVGMIVMGQLGAMAQRYSLSENRMRDVFARRDDIRLSTFGRGFGSIRQRE